MFFGLMNEPHSMPTEQWVKAANAAIAAIRDRGASNLILVPSNEWTGAWSWYSNWYGTPNAQTMLDIRDPLNWDVIEVHQYMDSDSSEATENCVSTTIGVERLREFTAWDAGFIGAWGEWHTSTNGLIGNTVGSEVNSKTRQIVNKLLEVVPSNRMITLRTPRYKQQLTGASALTRSQAFNGSSKARLGAKNDCFLASKNDWGTYLPDDDASIQAYKDFLHQDNLFLPQGGETCNAAEDAQPYIDCPNALSELAYMRYSTLNVGYHPDVLQGWKEGGCYKEISRRFGYRFELVSSSVPATIMQAQTLRMNFVVKNVGFASPYNARGLAIVLRHKATSQTYRMTLANGNSIPSNRTDDPRFWQPGTTATVSINRALPTGLPKGEYNVLLHLFDPAPALQSRSAYAIRFANLGTWESMTGYNNLLQRLTIE